MVTLVTAKARHTGLDRRTRSKGGTVDGNSNGNRPECYLRFSPLVRPIAVGRNMTDPAAEKSEFYTGGLVWWFMKTIEQNSDGPLG